MDELHRLLRARATRALAIGASATGASSTGASATRALATTLLLAAPLVLSLVTRPLGAQTTVNLDQAIGRARALVESGNGRAGRTLLDSLGRQLAVGTAALGELLYWRGLLSESSVDAERDWRRLLLEVPRSPRAEDALLRLAQLELLRGHPAEARPLLDRMARDYSAPPSLARAYFWMAKAWFDEGDPARACGAVQASQRNVPSHAVELRTQLAEFDRQCAGVKVVAIAEARAPVVEDGAPRATPSAELPAGVPPVAVETVARVEAPPASAPQTTPRSTPPVTPAANPPAAATTTPPAAPALSGSDRPAGARYSVQLAAWGRLDQAEAMVQQLAAEGVDARVDGTVRPFRVRTGYFRTRAEAARRLADFTGAGREGFIAELTP